jgi:hypothetical protein
MNLPRVRRKTVRYTERESLPPHTHSSRRFLLASAPVSAPPRASLHPVLNALLRFVLLYMFLSSWPWVDELIVNPAKPFRFIFDATFGSLARWTGAHIFHIPGTLARNSVLDTRYTYLVLLVVLVASIVLTVVWTILDRSSRSTRPAYALVRVWVRYTLAYMMLIYAMYKVFPVQFPPVTLRRLTESYGDSAPAALLSAFIGYSRTMSVLSGWAEAIGAVLLLFRRTAPMGAILTTVMMANVALMDFCYDIPVKMMAAHFLIMCIFLLAHDTDRLLRLVALNKPVPPADLNDLKDLPILKNLRARSPRLVRFMPIAMPVLKALVVLYVIVPVTVRTATGSRLLQYDRIHVPLRGIYAVTSYTINGVDQPLLVSQPRLWRYVIADSIYKTTIEFMDDTIVEYPSTFDKPTSQVRMHEEKGAPEAVSLILAPPAPGQSQYSISGQIGQNHVSAQLTPIPRESYTLVNRGFHWINESTFTR